MVYLRRITGKSKLPGIHKGQSAPSNNSAKMNGGSDPCDREGGSRGKDNCPTSYRRSMYLRVRFVSRWIFWLRKILLMITVRVSSAFWRCCKCPESGIYSAGYFQSVIITRMEGRTPVPSKEKHSSFAAHQATMVVFLSTGMLEELSSTSY